MEQKVDQEWPRLKAWYFSIVAHSADIVELRHGTWNAISHTLADDSKSGRLLRLVRRIDGSCSAEQIATSENIPLEEVQGLIDHLTELNALDFGIGSAMDYYADHALGKLGPGVAPPAEGREPPIVIGESEHLGAQISALLRAPASSEDPTNVHDALIRCAKASFEDGVAFEEAAAEFERWKGRLVVYATPTVNPLELRGLNRVCLHHRVPCVAGCVDGPFLLIGPTMVPGRTSCFECLDRRILMNLRESVSYQNYKNALLQGRVSGSTAVIDGIVASLLGSLLSIEALNFLKTGTCITVDKCLTVYLPTMEFSYNEILKVPGCPACGAAPERDELELYFDIRALLGSRQ